MNYEKAVYFDGQIESDWAGKEYTDEERKRIAWVLDFVGLEAGMSVLEPGCGTGRLTEILADRVGPAGRVIALEISAAMVEKASRRVAALPQADVFHGALEEWPFEDPFDLIMCHQVFPHFDDKERALERIALLMKADGTLVLHHFISSREINDLHRKVDPAVANDTMPGAESMERLMNSAGFQIQRFNDDDGGYLLVARNKAAGLPRYNEIT